MPAEDTKERNLIDPVSCGPEGRELISGSQGRGREANTQRLRAASAGAVSSGALAIGACALGALAIGALAVGRLFIGRAKIRRLEIDELIVSRLRITGGPDMADDAAQNRD